jgi:uncharacterized repeat protein (TIGR03803 family)
MHSFVYATNDGASPASALLQGTDGNFYGTTPVGGASVDYGTVFQINASGSSFTLLHSFSTATNDGDGPATGLVQGSDGNFYGTSEIGGASDDGVVFKLASTPALAAPITLTVPSSVAAGTSFTLSCAVANAYSATMQYCFATNAAGDTTGWTGILTGSPTATNATLTAPSTAGAYTYTLTCGGTETGFATLNVH